MLGLNEMLLGMLSLDVLAASKDVTVATELGYFFFYICSYERGL